MGAKASAYIEGATFTKRHGPRFHKVAWISVISINQAGEWLYKRMM
jgi:hypothetical protein